jgi:hypothetical protein
VPTVLAKVGVIKELKLLESKNNLKSGTSGGTMPTVLAKLGTMKEMKNLEISCNPTTMAQVEAQCLPFWPRWV